HGKATRIAITYNRDLEAEQVKLIIAHDGGGIEQETLPRETPRGMGLQIMRYRAESIGGALEIGPGPIAGTVVTVTFSEARRETTPDANSRSKR
ncbi:MAG: hypothetical protein JO069_03270, partial [Verrucomicrobia bacterium]|nr:hypothetical protein [Verrucomicrobiota bacterium]